MIKVYSEESYRSNPKVNQVEDSVRVVLLCKKTEWRRARNILIDNRLMLPAITEGDNKQ